MAVLVILYTQHLEWPAQRKCSTNIFWHLISLCPSGLWVVAAIGLAAGAGMYAVSTAATLMTLICLEAMHFIHLRHGEKVVSITVATDKPESVLEILDSLKKANINVESYTLQEGQIQMTLRMRILDYVEKLRTVFNLLEGVKIESLS